MRRGGTDGRKIVAVAVAGTVAVVGLAQIYLPFIADRDKIRGMFEEEYVPEGAKEQVDAMIKSERLRQQQQQQEAMVAPRENAGSMWSKLRRSQSGSGGM